MADKPFFMYFAPGATHAPHHVPKEWADKYKGKFDQGWDKLREQISRGRNKLGVIPQDCELTSANSEIPAWDSISPEMKPVLARQMEIYAGFLEHTDHHIGRLDRRPRRLGHPRRYADLRHHRRQRRVGRRIAAGHVQRNDPAQRIRAHSKHPSSSRAHSTSSADQRRTTTTPSAGPTRWTRPISGRSRWHRTGAARATARSCTGRTASRRRARSAHSSIMSSTSRRRCSKRRTFHSPYMVNGVLQKPIEGVSMAYSFNDAGAAERHETQYFEMFCNRGIYHKGWTAVTKHRTPWDPPTPSCRRSMTTVWELYDTTTGLVAGERSVEDTARKAARAPTAVVDRGDEVQRASPRRPHPSSGSTADLAGRPQLVKGDRQLLFGGMGRLSENSILNLHNKSHAITADVVVPKKSRRCHHRASAGSSAGGASTQRMGG